MGCLRAHPSNLPFQKKRLRLAVNGLSVVIKQRTEQGAGLGMV